MVPDRFYRDEAGHTLGRTFLLSAFLTLLLPVGYCLSAQDFSVYERDIIERQPFGEAPKQVQPVKVVPPEPAKPSIFKYLELVAITDGEWVGFINRKNKKSYYLRVGESEDGLRVVDAFPETESASLSYEGFTETIKMPGSLQALSDIEREFVDNVDGGTSYSESSVSKQKMTAVMAKLRKERMERLERTAAAIEKKMAETTPEERRKHLEQTQMDLIRAKGAAGPVLPMKLTKEMDDKLVEEGVIPPR